MLQLLPAMVYAADVKTRADLNLGYFPDERAYVATFLARAQDFWTLAGGKSELAASVVPSRAEQFFGIDALMVFRTGTEAKILAIEAKYPRFHGPSKPVDNWLKGQAGIQSRFMRQLRHQGRLPKSVTVVAMFIDDAKPPSYTKPLDSLGSSFAHRDCLMAYDASRIPAGGKLRPWSASDFLGVLASSATASRNAAQIVEEVVVCASGDKMTMDELLTLRLEGQERSAGAGRDVEATGTWLRSLADRLGARTAVSFEGASFPEDEKLRSEYRKARLESLTHQVPSAPRARRF